MQQSPYTIRLPDFEGPFDLLFHLITKAEVDIWSISIAEITDQYLHYLRSMQELNLDLAGEFLVMAARLLRLKSRLLLPLPPRAVPEEDEEEALFGFNSPEELFVRLEEYRRFKGVAEWLKEKEIDQQKIFLRSTGGKKVLLANKQQSYYTFQEGGLGLAEIMRQYLETAVAAEYHYTPLEDYSIRDQIKLILRSLHRQEGPVAFKTLLTEKGRRGVVATFTALLELARRQSVLLLQNCLFGTILVTYNHNRGKQ